MKNMKYTYLGVAGMALLLSLSACGGKQRPNQMMQGIIVSTASVKAQMWQPSVDSVGTLSANNGMMIQAETAGRVTAIYAQSGQLIKKGEPIIDIFPNVIQAQLQQYTAQNTLNQLTYKREAKLAQSNYSSQETLDQAQAQMQMSAAQMTGSQAQLTQNLVRAPFDGKVGLVSPSIGQYLQPGDNIVQLQAVSPLYVEFSVPSQYLHSVQAGDSVTIQSSTSKQSFSGKVYALDSMIDTNTRTLSVRASMPNKDEELLPGEFVTVTLFLDKPQSVIVLPQVALNYSYKGEFVYTVNSQNQAIVTPVKVGPHLGANNVIVFSGLKAGDTVITEGQLKLQNGTPIVTEEQAKQLKQQASEK